MRPYPEIPDHKRQEILERHETGRHVRTVELTAERPCSHGDVEVRAITEGSIGVEVERHDFFITVRVQLIAIPNSRRRPTAAVTVPLKYAESLCHA